MVCGTRRWGVWHQVVQCVAPSGVVCVAPDGVVCGISLCSMWHQEVRYVSPDRVVVALNQLIYDTIIQ